MTEDLSAGECFVQGLADAFVCVAALSSTPTRWIAVPRKLMTVLPPPCAAYGRKQVTHQYSSAAPQLPCGRGVGEYISAKTVLSGISGGSSSEEKAREMNGKGQAAFGKGSQEKHVESDGSRQRLHFTEHLSAWPVARLSYRCNCVYCLCHVTAGWAVAVTHGTFRSCCSARLSCHAVGVA